VRNASITTYAAGSTSINKKRRWLNNGHVFS